MAWNEAAYGVLGSCSEPDGVGDELAVFEGSLGGPMPAAVREWYLRGGDRRLASISSNLITRVPDFTSRTVGRFLEHGYLLLESDSQHCCRWVVVGVSAVDGDPPVFLIDSDDDVCATRSRYAATFSDYAFTAAWDATLWAGEPSVDFDHPLTSGALNRLRHQLTELPTTRGWAMNQGCDAVYRFTGAAQVAVAVAGDTAVWSAIASPSTAVAGAFARLTGATSNG